MELFKTILVCNLKDLLLKILEMYEKCNNSVNVWAREMFFFSMDQKWIGAIIRVLVRHLRV